jgi:hypothetical protein
MLPFIPRARARLAHAYGHPYGGVLRPEGSPACERCAAAASTQEASLRQYRSVGLRRPLSVVPQRSRCVEDRPARDCDPLAPCRVQSLLAVEIEASRRKAEGIRGDTPTDPCHEPCEPTMGRTADSRRTSQARHRHWADERGEVYGAAQATALSGLANVSSQPCRRHRRDGPVRRSDDFVPAPLRLADPAP